MKTITPRTPPSTRRKRPTKAEREALVDARRREHQARHNAEWSHPRNPFAAALRKMFDGWTDYAAAHKARYDTSIGKDYVIGEYWADLGHDIRRLLDGETGALDCGSVDHLIRETMLKAKHPRWDQ